MAVLSGEMWRAPATPAATRPVGALVEGDATTVPVATQPGFLLLVDEHHGEGGGAWRRLGEGVAEVSSARRGGPGRLPSGAAPWGPGCALRVDATAVFTVAGRSRRLWLHLCCSFPLPGRRSSRTREEADMNELRAKAEHDPDAMYELGRSKTPFTRPPHRPFWALKISRLATRLDLKADLPWGIIW